MRQLVGLQESNAVYASACLKIAYLRPNLFYMFSFSLQQINIKKYSYNIFLIIFF